ncbi:hypothetical protein SAMN05444695_102117 [Rhodococcus triatomae]|uniref:Uncharacterized protein n=1 Tax=Rhodococcus triatomae TaxID=300028 RepID=A0A1G8CUS2_9NOCA|nr:hypothetical protein SAMN05444695_102117 [Rhodococcus triatomae]
MLSLLVGFGATVLSLGIGLILSDATVKYDVRPLTE